MEIIILILIFVIVLAFIAVVFLNSYFKNKKGAEKDDVGLQLILQQLNELSRTVDSKIGESQKEVRESLQFHSTRSIS